jgi:peptidoglycan/LPS O-acetylase OafA/YrhL
MFNKRRTEPAEKAKHVRSLDSLRGIAALMVVVFHFPIVTSLSGVPLFRNAWLCVDFFFVLSGFVISFAYGERLNSAAAGIRFVIRRFGRLWPLHVTLLVAFASLQLAKAIAGFLHAGLKTDAFTGVYSLSDLPANFLLFQAVPINSAESWNGPAWSISVEFYTYIIFAAAALAFRIHRHPILCSAISIACGVGLYFLSPKYMQTVSAGVITAAILRCMCGFFVGVSVHWLWKRYRLTRPGTLAEVTAVVLTVLFMSLRNMYTPYSLAAPVLFGAVIFVMAHEAGRISTLLLNPAFIRLGELSYSIYMVHFFIFQVIRIVFTKSLNMAPIRDADEPAKLLYNIVNPFVGDIVLVGMMAIVIGTSALTYRLVEVPGRDYSQRIAERVRSGADRQFL